MKLLILLAVSALAQDLNTAENRHHGHVGHGTHHGGLHGIGIGHHRGRRDVDEILILAKSDILGDQSSEESRALGHRGSPLSGHPVLRNGNTGGWGAHVGPNRWTRDVESVLFIDNGDLALEESRWGGRGVGGHGHGHVATGLGHRGRRDVESVFFTNKGDLALEESRWGGRGVGGHGHGHVATGLGHRGRRDVELFALDSGNLAWGGRPSAAGSHVWNRGTVVSHHNTLKSHW